MTRVSILVALATLAATSSRLKAQSLDDRIAAAREARVQFTYAARPDVCGHGRTFIQVSGREWYGPGSDGDHRDSCLAGPVRVVLDRAGRDIVSIAAFVRSLP